MKSLIKILAVALIMATAVASCEDDNGSSSEYCYSELETPVNEVTGPATAEVGQEITFAVKFNTGNGCYKRARFAENGNNPKEIKIFSTYEGCICTEQTELITKEYKFKPTAVGTYSLKFKNANNTFITKTVDVTL